jgi:hypothetical protein
LNWSALEEAQQGEERGLELGREQGWEEEEQQEEQEEEQEDKVWLEAEWKGGYYWGKAQDKEQGHRQRSRSWPLALVLSLHGPVDARMEQGKDQSTDQAIPRLARRSRPVSENKS